jgi:hypothetical protein
MKRENDLKANRFSDAVQSKTGELLSDVQDRVPGRKHGEAIGLLGEYLEWRLKGAQEPVDGYDNRAL